MSTSWVDEWEKSIGVPYGNLFKTGDFLRHVDGRVGLAYGSSGQWLNVFLLGGSLATYRADMARAYTPTDTERAEIQQSFALWKLSQ